MSKKLRELKARKAALVQQASALTAAAADREFTDQESTDFASLKAQIEGVNKQIEAEEFIQEQAASVDIGGGTFIQVEENSEKDAKRGFRSFGEFASAVASASTKGVIDQRLTIGAAAPTTFGNEGAGQDGGFAIPPEFSREIWRLSLGEDSLLPLTDNTEISGNSMMFPKDESTPWGGTGVQAYWQVEAGQGNQSKPNITAVDALVLHKLMALVPVTNELISDGYAIGSYLQAQAPEKITWKTNEAILFGDGNGKPLGALNSSAAVVQAKDSGQVANTVTNNNLANMVSRLLVGQLKNAVWIGTPDILGPLEAMTVGNYPVYLPGMTSAEAPYGLLKGRPLMLSEHAAQLSSQGDLNLVSLKGYRTITKAGGLETATSMHLFFDSDVTAFRFIFRINGKPILSQPVTPPKSTTKRSHFVSLAAR